MKKPGFWRRFAFTFALLLFVVWTIQRTNEGDLLTGPIGLAILWGVHFLNTIRLSVMLKSALNDAFIPPTYRPANPGDFKALDVNELARRSHEWEALGFTHVGDWEVAENDAPPGSTFERTFEHPGMGAMVQLTQEFAPAHKFALKTTIVSFWGERERLETLHESQRLQSTHNVSVPVSHPHLTASSVQEPELVLWALLTTSGVQFRWSRLFQHRRQLLCHLRPGATSAQLWQAHRERSALIQARLKQPALQGDLLDLQRHYERVRSAVNANRVKKLSIWTLRPYYAKPFSLEPMNYDGELAPL